MKTRPLELTGAELRAMLRAAGDKLAEFLDSLPEQPTARLAGGKRLARSLEEPLPEEGAPFSALLAQVAGRIAPRSLNTASGGYLGFIPGGGLPHAAVADLLTGTLNRYTGLWLPAPGLVQLEIAVIRWLCGVVGYGPGAGGLLTSGGSLANLGAIVAAREAHPAGRDGVVYASAQAHHSVRKSARIAGFLPEQIRALPTDAAFRLPPAAVAAAVAADRAAGLSPLLVVASAGTTAVGAIDPLPELAALCAAEGLWLHVDAAYGGAFALTARGRAALAGLDAADSIALDPHKGFFLPYGTGCLLVRDRAALRRAFAEGASYLPPGQEDPDAWDFADLGPELSRPARGLRLWLPLKMHGAAAFRAALDEKLDLAAAAFARLRALPHVRAVAPPALSLFALRVEPPGLSPAETDALNRRILSRVNRRQRVFLTGATVHDPAVGAEVFVARVCVLSFRTHAEHIDALVEDFAAAMEEARG